MSSSASAPKTTCGDRIGLGWFCRLLSSSIGQKFVMGITGLLLCGFLVAHLAGNLLLFVGAEAFNAYGKKLHDNWELLVIAEIGLFVLFLMHIYLAITLSIGNSQSREEQYAVRTTKIPGRIVGAKSWMFASGAVVLGFVLLHLIDLRIGVELFNLRGFAYGKTQYEQTVMVLSDPVSRIFYTIGAIVLGIHLSHGFASAFQSLGLNHPKYMPLIKLIGKIFAVVIAVGFASLAIFIPEIARHAIPH